MLQEQDPRDPSAGGSAISRRRLLAASAVGGATAWAAPAVLGVGSASAAVSPMTCTSTSRDVSLVTTGPVSGDAGPVQSYPGDAGCFDDHAVQIPGTTGAQVFAKALCAHGEDSGTDGVCRASASVGEVRFDLNTVGLDVTGRGETLTASKACGAAESTASSLAEVAVTVNGVPLVIPVNPPANTAIPIIVPGVLTGTLTLNGDFGDCRRAFDLQVTHVTSGQTAHLVIAEACCSD